MKEINCEEENFINPRKTMTIAFFLGMAFAALIVAIVMTIIYWPVLTSIH